MSRQLYTFVLLNTCSVVSILVVLLDRILCNFKMRNIMYKSLVYSVCHAVALNLYRYVCLYPGPPRGGYRRYTVPGPMTRRGAHENMWHDIAVQKYAFWET